MKKSFMELAQQIETIQEDKQGKLQGGFSAIEISFENNFQSELLNSTCPTPSNRCPGTNVTAGSCGMQ